jgi:hypothetical protein
LDRCFEKNDSAIAVWHLPHVLRSFIVGFRYTNIKY